MSRAPNQAITKTAQESIARSIIRGLPFGNEPRTASTTKRSKRRSKLGDNRSSFPKLPKRYLTPFSHLLSQAQHFDPKRGALNTFIARVVNSGVAMLVRDRTRIKRRPDDDMEVQSLEDKVEQPHGPPAPLWIVISLEDLQRRIGSKSLTDAEVFELADEIASVMESMPKELRDICESLQHRNRRETESELGLSRRKFNAAMTRIREHFSKSGLGKS